MTTRQFLISVIKQEIINNRFDMVDEYLVSDNTSVLWNGIVEQIASNEGRMDYYNSINDRSYSMMVGRIKNAIRGCYSYWITR